MKRKTYQKTSELAIDLGLSVDRALIADMKANLTQEIIKLVQKKNLTHKEVSDLSGVPRSAITGIINVSLQKVSIERLIRILSSLGKTIEFKIKRAA